MKIAKAIREKKRKFVSLSELRNLLAKYNILEKGMTKSNEKILSYKGKEFTIPREKKEGFKLDDVLDKIAYEMTKVDFGTPEVRIRDAFLLAYEKKRKELALKI